MQTAPLVVLDVPRDERARRIYREYVDAPLSTARRRRSCMSASPMRVDRIRRRLGGTAPRAMRGASTPRSRPIRRTPAAHLAWIEQLLEWYYDPMYDHQLTAKQGRVVLNGRSGDASQPICRQRLTA